MYKEHKGKNQDWLKNKTLHIQIQTAPIFTPF